MARVNIQVARSTKAWDHLSKWLKWRGTNWGACLSLLALLSMSRTIGIAWAVKWKVMIFFLLFGISDPPLLLKWPPITTESWLNASHFLLLSCLPHIFSSPNKSSWAWTIIEESEDEMKTMMMITTKKDNCVSRQCNDSRDMNSIEATKLMMH